MPGDDSTPDDTSMPNGPHARDRLGDVVGRQPAGQHDRRGARAMAAARSQSIVAAGAAAAHRIVRVEQQHDVRRPRADALVDVAGRARPP